MTDERPAVRGNVSRSHDFSRQWVETGNKDRELVLNYLALSKNVVKSGFYPIFRLSVGSLSKIGGKRP
jgi:hypothetical protein